MHTILDNIFAFMLEAALNYVFTKAYKFSMMSHMQVSRPVKLPPFSKRVLSTFNLRITEVT